MHLNQTKCDQFLNNAVANLNHKSGRVSRGGVILELIFNHPVPPAPCCSQDSQELVSCFSRDRASLIETVCLDLRYECQRHEEGLREGGGRFQVFFTQLIVSMASIAGSKKLGLNRNKSEFEWFEKVIQSKLNALTICSPSERANIYNGQTDEVCVLQKFRGNMNKDNKNLPPFSPHYSLQLFATLKRGALIIQANLETLDTKIWSLF